MDTGGVYSDHRYILYEERPQFDHDNQGLLDNLRDRKAGVELIPVPLKRGNVKTSVTRSAL